MDAQGLRELREKRGWSVRELARRVNVSTASLAAYETGTRRPAASTLIRILDSLQASDEERLLLLETIGYRVYPHGSILKGDADRELDRTLLGILANHQLTARDLAERLGLPGPELERYFSEYVPPDWLFGKTVSALELDDGESRVLLGAWAFQAAVLAPREDLERLSRIGGSLFGALLALFGHERGSTEELRNKALSILSRLKTDLGLSASEIAEMLDASEPEIEDWLNGRTALPFFVIARIAPLGPALDTLVRLFSRQRLPDVVRRRARLFDGDTAINRIMHGQIEAVAAAYDRALQYAP